MNSQKKLGLIFEIGFLRYIDERDLLTRAPLKIQMEYPENDKEAKRRTELRMISYIFARIYILYFRQDIHTLWSNFETQLDYCLVFIFESHQFDEVSLSLAFHLSQSFIDPDILAVQTVLRSFQHNISFLANLAESEAQEAEKILREAHEIYYEKIIHTAGFREALISFLKSCKYSEQDFEAALKIIKKLNL